MKTWAAFLVLTVYFAGQDNCFAGDLPKGIAILNSLSSFGHEGADNIPFKNIRWVSFYGGILTKTDGTEVPFPDTGVTKIVYLDGDFYAALKNDRGQSAFRQGMDLREILIETHYTDISSRDQINSLQNDQIRLKDLAETAPNCKDVFFNSSSVLGNYIAQLKSGNFLVKGQWINATLLIPTPRPNPQALAGMPTTWTTVDGQTFTGVSVSSADGTSVSIIHDRGGGNLPLDNIPMTIVKKLPPNIRASIASANLQAYESDISNPRSLEDFLRLSDHDFALVSLDDSVSATFKADWVNKVTSDYANSSDLHAVVQQFPSAAKTLNLSSSDILQAVSRLLSLSSLTHDDAEALVDVAASQANPEKKEEVDQWHAALIAYNANDAAFSSFADDIQKPLAPGPESSVSALPSTLTKRVPDLKTAINTQALQFIPSFTGAIKTLDALDKFKSLCDNIISKDIQANASLIETITNDFQGRSLSPGEEKVSRLIMVFVNYSNQQMKLFSDTVSSADEKAAIGGHSSEAVGLYQKAYDINHNPDILKKIKALNRNSLGL